MLLKEAGAKLIKNLMKHAHSNIRPKKENVATFKIPEQEMIYL